jgi:hypothetical protein
VLADLVRPVPVGARRDDRRRPAAAVEETQTRVEPGTDAALPMEGWMTLTALDAVSQVALGVPDDELRAAAGV